MLEASTVLRKSPSQVSCVLNEEVAVLNVDKALYFGLQGVGAHIWEFIETPHSVAEICDDVTANFDVAPDVCRQDVLTFLGGLLDAGLIETAR